MEIIKPENASRDIRYEFQYGGKPS